jgi:pimeloyl-ACP methyl ester carboxylesterase
LAEPERFASLVLISPTGLSERTQRNTIQKSDMYGYGSVLHSIFSVPLWSQALYDLIASRLSLRYFLRQSFEGEVPEAWIDYAYLTSHRPGARYAPLYFISGKLFTLDALESIYEKIAQPTLVIYDYDPFTSFDELPGLLQRRSNWHAERILPTRGLAHWEQAEHTTAALDRFWASR